MPNIKKVIVNGVEYPSLDAMPKEVRALYDQAMASLTDSDHDGVPDILQNPGTTEMQTQQTVIKEFLQSKSPPAPVYGAPFPGESRRGDGFPWSLILALVAAVALLAGLWLSGVTPAELLRRFR